jgi:hypothetical protein
MKTQQLRSDLTTGADSKLTCAMPLPPRPEDVIKVLQQQQCACLGTAVVDFCVLDLPVHMLMFGYTDAHFCLLISVTCVSVCSAGRCSS